MSSDGKYWDMRRAEQLRSAMTVDEIRSLKAKGETNPASLSLDEVGVLFLLARDRIREIERLADGKGGKQL
jgi:DNA-directed RNA polymerase sigma subunit (sigma70/sigma32)